MDISAFTKVEVSGPGRRSAARPAGGQPAAAETGRHRADPYAQPPRPDRAGNHGRAHGARTGSISSARPSSSSACSIISTFIADGEDVTVTTRSRRLGALALNGPKARDIWPPAPMPARQRAFRWLSAQEIESPATRCGPSACPMRASWAGSCTCPREHMLAVYDALWAAAKRMASPTTAASP
jgi:glycine cleavage system aminomethyltransferase T